jgi:hypothetical protein
MRTKHLLLILGLWGLAFYGCNGDGQNGVDSGPDADGADGGDDDPSQWSHERLMAGAKVLRPDSANGIAILFVEGNHYQMGYQHGFLMKDEIQELRESLRTDELWAMAFECAFNNGPDPETNSPTYAELSIDRAFDFLLEECRGLVHGCDGVVNMQECVIVNSLLWMIEDAFNIHIPIARLMYGCSQFAAVNTATASGNLVHGRNMDLPMTDSVVQMPLVIVRQPEGKLRFVTMAWPASICTWTGINEAGLVIAINDHLCLPDPEVYNLDGVPHLQMFTKIMMEAQDLDQALEIVDAHQASGCSHFFMSHGPSKDALVIEITANHTQVRYLENDVVFATNHFLMPGVMDDQDVPDIEDLNSSTVSRFTRLMERLTGQSKPPHPGLSPDAPDYAWGKIDVPTAIEIMRDPVDMRPHRDRACKPCDSYGPTTTSLGNNFAMYSYVFLPEELKFWMAARFDEECENPIYSPYIGFDLNDLFSGTYTEDLVPTYDPDYNCPTR